jgi:hypothetical protein
VPLRDVQLDHQPDMPFDGLTGTDDVASDVLPLRPDGTAYARYSEALADLAAPATLHNPALRS